MLASLLVASISLLCKGHTTQFVTSVMSTFSEQFQRCSFGVSVLTQRSFRGGHKLRKKQTSHWEESLLRNLYAQQTRCNLQSTHSVPLSGTYFQKQWTGRGQKEAALLWQQFFFFFWHKAFSLSPWQKHIAAFRLPGEKHVSKRKPRVAVRCLTNTLAPRVVAALCISLRFIRSLPLNQFLSCFWWSIQHIHRAQLLSLTMPTMH